MKITLTLYPDVAQLLSERMEADGLSREQAINHALRSALSSSPDVRADPYELPTFHMGHPPDVDLDKALSIAAEDEDAAVLDKMDPRRPR